MIAVALCGLSGVGKGTACKILSKIANDALLKVSILKFGDVFDNCVRDCFEIESLNEFNEFISGEIYFKQRSIPCNRLVEKFSTHLRNANNNLSIDYMSRLIEHYKEQKNSFVIIPDLQFKKEIIWCKENNVNIIKLEKTNTFLNTYVNESSIPNFLCDVVINNDKEKEDLEKALISTFVKLRAESLQMEL